MPRASARVLESFPYPIAYPYSLAFAAERTPADRCWALCFTEYQLLRTVCLPLLGQYLREGGDDAAADSLSALNRTVAAIRSPFFSDWITLVFTLRRHLPRVGIEPLFPRLGAALDALRGSIQRPVPLRGDHRLDPFRAILALRNQTAHGGLPDQDEAARHLDDYLPVLGEVLAAFDFLGECDLLVCEDPQAVAAGRGRVRSLRGAHPTEAIDTDLDDDLAAAFAESRAVLKTAEGRAAPLYPLFNTVADQEPLYLYDGHYGIRVETSGGVEERSYVYYLGTFSRATDSRSCERLRELLARRRISFLLEKNETAPWTIADSAADYSRRTLEELRGTKYFPECYLPFEDLEHHLEAFLRVPDPGQWGGDTGRRRHVNGFVLVGLAGAGKTALLARAVEKLLGSAREADDRENPNLVLFLRGNGIAVRPEGLSLFRDLAEKLGVAVQGAGGRPRRGGGFSTFRELLDHLHGRWRQDRVAGRRLIVVLDALNEAPYAEKVVREALDLAGLAACYPWCKVVLSTRQEWLDIWSGKLGVQETSPLEEMRPWLYATDPRAAAGRQGPPVVHLEPFTAAQARQVYERYQAARRMGAGGTGGRGLGGILGGPPGGAGDRGEPGSRADEPGRHPGAAGPAGGGGGAGPAGGRDVGRLLGGRPGEPPHRRRPGHRPQPARLRAGRGRTRGGGHRRLPALGGPAADPAGLQPPRRGDHRGAGLRPEQPRGVAAGGGPAGGGGSRLPAGGGHSRDPVVGASGNAPQRGPTRQGVDQPRQPAARGRPGRTGGRGLRAGPGSPPAHLVRPPGDAAQRHRPGGIAERLRRLPHAARRGKAVELRLGRPVYP
jgi:hypothetical protein